MIRTKTHNSITHWTNCLSLIIFNINLRHDFYLKSLLILMNGKINIVVKGPQQKVCLLVFALKVI